MRVVEKCRCGAVLAAEGKDIEVRWSVRAWRELHAACLTTESAETDVRGGVSEDSAESQPENPGTSTTQSEKRAGWFDL